MQTTISFRRFLSVATLVWASAALQVQAHEFWFVPVPSPQPVGQTLPLRLEVGEFFEGDAAGFSQARTERMYHYTGGKQVDLKPFLSSDSPEAEVLFSLASAGTHLLAFDSTPLKITLSSDTFHAYLHDEGLDFVKAQREKAGTADQPGRERYHRTVKTLIHAGRLPKSGVSTDNTHAVRVGQRLELTPLQNPFVRAPGQVLGFQIDFDGKPLAGALVKAWHHRKGQLITIRTRTTAAGRADFQLPYAGGWMVSVVHMIPTVNDTEIDWDSYWGNVTFSLPSR